MSRLVLAMAVGALAGCAERYDPAEHKEASEAPSYYVEHSGLKLPEEVRRNLQVELAKPEVRTFSMTLEKTARVFEPTLAAVSIGRDEADNLQPREDIVRIEQPFASSNHCEVILRLSEPQPVGSHVPVKLRLQPGSASLAVPASAVVHAADADYVYIEEDGYFVSTEVSTGILQNGWTQILKGVTAEHRIVARAAMDLRMIELLALRGGSACCH